MLGYTTRTATSAHPGRRWIRVDIRSLAVHGGWSLGQQPVVCHGGPSGAVRRQLPQVA